MEPATVGAYRVSHQGATRQLMAQVSQLSRGRSLAAVAGGRLVRIEALHAGQTLNHRLTELGLRSGVVVEVLQNHGRDGVIVGLGSERLALPVSLAVCIGIAEETRDTGRSL